jgi:hypothetical protein
MGKAEQETSLAWRHRTCARERRVAIIVLPRIHDAPHREAARRQETAWRRGRFNQRASAATYSQACWRKQALDEQLDLQHKCGGEMQTTVEKMQRRLKALREAAAVAPDTISDEGADEGELPDSSGLVGPP